MILGWRYPPKNLIIIWWQYVYFVVIEFILTVDTCMSYFFFMFTMVLVDLKKEKHANQMLLNMKEELNENWKKHIARSKTCAIC